LIIADAPTTALDVTTQAQTLQLIADLRDGTGMVPISSSAILISSLARAVLQPLEGVPIEVLQALNAAADPRTSRPLSPPTRL
jgi:peptide/nickel transport system ATP-binding protein